MPSRAFIRRFPRSASHRCTIRLWQVVLGPLPEETTPQNAAHSQSQSERAGHQGAARLGPWRAEAEGSCALDVGLTGLAHYMRAPSSCGRWKAGLISNRFPGTLAMAVTLPPVDRTSLAGGRAHGPAVDCIGMRDHDDMMRSAEIRYQPGMGSVSGASRLRVSGMIHALPPDQPRATVFSRAFTITSTTGPAARSPL